MSCKDIDKYINVQPDSAIALLNQMREIIKDTVPHATEHLSYGLPTFKLNKVLVHFSVMKNHIGLYPGPEPIIHFKEALTGYKTSKGTIRFKIDEPLPVQLIKDIVLFKLNLITN